MVAACTQYQRDLSAYLDNELDSTRRSQVCEHLKNCPPCLQEFEGLKAVSRIMADGARKMTFSSDIWSQVAMQLPTVCQVIEEDLSAYLDGELPVAAQEGIREHLKECAACLAKFSRINATNKLLAGGLKLPDTIKIELWPAVKSRLNEDCALIQSELSAFADKEVATLRHRVITAHLIDCANCRGSFEQLSQVLDFVGRFYQPVFPDNFDLWPAVKDKLKVVPFTTKSKPKPKIGGHRLYLVGAAAVLVGVIGSVAFLFMGPTESTIRPVSAEAYLLDSALSEPVDSVETVVYENP